MGAHDDDINCTIPHHRSGSADNSLIIRAINEMGGPGSMTGVSEDVCDQLRQKLGTYGRPIPNKDQIMSQTTSLRDELYSSSNDHHKIRHTSSGIRKRNRKAVTWSTLNSISICDLKLYGSNEGGYIEGRLIVDPFTPIVGTTTVLEDSNGDVVPVVLYNFLPGGLHGEASNALACMKFPKGCKVRIAEPLFKVFRDGSRGIRVDDPNEIKVTMNQDDMMSGKKEEDALIHAGIMGNLLAEKKMHLSACEAYILGLRRAYTVAALLSDRSQAYAKLGNWGRSFMDAAASLTLQPDTEKAWQCYRQAAGHLSSSVGVIHTGQDRAWQIMKRCFVSIGADRQTEVSCNGGTALQLREEGNRAFESCDYRKAAGYYSAAICDKGNIPRALLESWASCCLSTGAYLDVVAASAASLRIRQDGRSLIRLARALVNLGETKLCRSVLNKRYHNMSNEDFFQKHKHELLRCTGDLFEQIKVNDFLEPKPCDFAPPSCIPRWNYAGIEVFSSAGQGRGIRTKTDMKAGQLVLVDPPIASSLSGDDLVFNVDKTEVRKSTDEHIVQAVVIRAQREGVLSKILDKLDDGINAEPNVTLSDLRLNLASNEVLLPSLHEYYSGDIGDRVKITRERIGSIISVNSFGRDGDDFSESHNTRLYSTLSMFNHSSHPSCRFIDVGGCAVLFSGVDVKAGSELTIQYHSDKEVLRRHWGIVN